MHRLREEVERLDAALGLLLRVARAALAGRVGVRGVARVGYVALDLWSAVSSRSQLQQGSKCLRVTRGRYSNV
jgi:hypothetical protein